MLRTVLHRLRWPLLAVSAAALMLTTTTALAGSGVGGVFNLGQTNSVNGTSTLTGSSAGAQLQVANTNTGAYPAIKGSSASGAASAFSLYALLSSTTPGAGSAAVRGQNNGTGSA